MSSSTVILLRPSAELHGTDAIHDCLSTIRSSLSKDIQVALELDHLRLNDDDVMFLVSELCEMEECIQFTHFSLSGNYITDFGFQIITERLLSSQKHVLNSVRLVSNRITFRTQDNFPVLLAETLNSKNTLKELALSTNDLSEDAVCLFIDHLSCASLTSLVLNACHLSSKAARSISRYLHDFRNRCPGLVNMQLNGNMLGSSDISIIAAPIIFGRNTGIGKLDLYGNETGTSEFKADDNDDIVHLQDIYLAESYSYISDDILNSLRNVLGRNRWCRYIIKKAAAKLLQNARLILLGVSKSLPPSSYFFPFLKLPTEIQLHILKHFAALESVRFGATCSDPGLLATIPSSLRSQYISADMILPPLNNKQFQRVIEYSSSRSTLSAEYNFQLFLTITGCTEWDNLPILYT